jgi:citrate synthase
MRQLASTLVDPYSAVAGSAAALYGPLHGGANEAVLRMLQRIGEVKNVPAFIEEVKSRKTKLFGFGSLFVVQLTFAPGAVLLVARLKSVSY